MLCLCCACAVPVLWPCGDCAYAVPVLYMCCDQARHGPIVYDHLWHGEIYDQRQENSAWSVPAKKMTPKVRWR